MDLLKKFMFFPNFLKYFKKLVADIKTWSKNIIKLDSIFVFSASFFQLNAPYFTDCASLGIYTLWLHTCHTIAFGTDVSNSGLGLGVSLFVLYTQPCFISNSGKYWMFPVHYRVKEPFVMFVGNNFLGQTVSFGIC